MLTDRILKVLKAATVEKLISAYGNEFFVAGQAGVDYAKSIGEPGLRFQRNTLNAIARMGLLRVEPGLAGRGEFTLTDKGRQFLREHGL